MNKLILLVLIFMVYLSEVDAQKFGYIDSDYILGKLPEYKKAQNEINKLSLSWQQEIEHMQMSLDSMRKAYEGEQVLLTDKMREERTEEIQNKEHNLATYQKKIFGFEGVFFLKKQELIKPLQDKIFEAIKKVAKTNKLAIIFDKAGELIMLYTDPIHDYTDFVLEQLGLGDPNDKIK